MWHQNFVIVGAFVLLLGSLSYIIDTLRSRVQPNKVSWGLWALAPLIAFFAELQEGVGLESLFTLMTGICALIIFLASFFNKKSHWDINRLDMLCGGLSLLGLVLWYITKVGDVAIWFSILADFLAGFPTVRKAYTHPESESPQYISVVISALLTLLTLKSWTFAQYGFPLYSMILFAVITFFVVSKVGKRAEGRR